MRIENVPGEYGFKALIARLDDANVEGWQLTDIYFFSEEEVERYIKSAHGGSLATFYKWPVDFQENGAVYVPSEDELK